MKKKSIDEFAPLRIFFENSFLFFLRHLSQERYNNLSHLSHLSLSFLSFLRGVRGERDEEKEVQVVISPFSSSLSVFVGDF